MEYKIEVSLNPENNKYFWIIFGRKEGTVGWANFGFGWNVNPVLAFKDAYEHYVKNMEDVDNEILKKFVN